MTNTYLYQRTETGEFHCYRLLTHGAPPFIMNDSSLENLALDMKSVESLLRKPFELEGGIPEVVRVRGNPEKLRPLNEEEVERVAELLRN